MEKKGEVSTGTLHRHGIALPDIHHGADLGGLPLLRGRPFPPSHLPTAKATTASVVSSNGTFLGENREKTNIMCGGRRRRMVAVVVFVIGTHTYLFSLCKPKNYGKKQCWKMFVMLERL